MKRFVLIIALFFSVIAISYSAYPDVTYKYDGRKVYLHSPHPDKNPGMSLDMNRHYNKMALNQRPSLYSLGKKDNIFDKSFRSKSVRFAHRKGRFLGL